MPMRRGLEGFQTVLGSWLNSVSVDGNGTTGSWQLLNVRFRVEGPDASRSIQGRSRFDWQSSIQRVFVFSFYFDWFAEASVP